MLMPRLWPCLFEFECPTAGVCEIVSSSETASRQRSEIAVHQPRRAMLLKLSPNHPLRRGDLIARHEFQRVSRIFIKCRRQFARIISFQQNLRDAVGFGVRRVVAESFNHREFILLLAKQNVALAEVQQS